MSHLKTFFLFGIILIYQTSWSLQKMSISCTPESQNSLPIRVGWDTLLKINSIVSYPDAGAIAPTGILVNWDYYDAFKGNNLNTTDKFSFKVGLPGDLYLTTPDKLNAGPTLSAVMFQFLEAQFPMTNGPVPDGIYDSEASLVLVSTYRERSGSDVKNAVAHLILTCKTTVAE